jgi:hypothetical protein
MWRREAMPCFQQMEQAQLYIELFLISNLIVEKRNVQLACK